MAIMWTVNKHSIDGWFCCSNAQLHLVTDSKTKGYQSVDLSGLPTTLLLFTCTFELNLTEKTGIVFASPEMP